MRKAQKKTESEDDSMDLILQEKENGNGVGINNFSDLKRKCEAPSETKGSSLKNTRESNDSVKEILNENYRNEEDRNMREHKSSIGRTESMDKVSEELSIDLKQYNGSQSKEKSIRKTSRTLEENNESRHNSLIEGDCKLYDSMSIDKEEFEHEIQNDIENDDRVNKSAAIGKGPDDVKYEICEKITSDTAKEESKFLEVNQQLTFTKDLQSWLHEENKEQDDLEQKAENTRGLLLSTAPEVSLGMQNVDASAGVMNAVENLSREELYLPSFSRWFNINCIHSIEKRALPEFFNGHSKSKTAKIYFEYRNYMIFLWRKNPSQYLNATTARQNLVGDVCAILRVYEFLDHWGIINSTADYRPKTSHGSLFDPQKNDIATDSKMLLSFDDGGPVTKKNVDKGAIQGMASRKEVYAAAVAVQYHCDFCREDCSGVRFHCTTKADMDICPKCFAGGEYPPTMDAKDFIQMTAVAGGDGYYDSTAWTESETLLLLEALEMYSDNWDLVAEHVGTKSKDSCVLQFLRLPIEDSYLEDTLVHWNGVDKRKVGDLSPLSLPFSDSENQTLTQVVYLASSVSPDAGAATAQEATKLLCNTDWQSERVNHRNYSASDYANSKIGFAAAEKVRSIRKIAESSVDSDHAISMASEATAAVILAAAAARAKALAEEECLEIETLFHSAMEIKVKALQLKLKHFNILQKQLSQERYRLKRHYLDICGDFLTTRNDRKGKFENS